VFLQCGTDTIKRTEVIYIKSVTSEPFNGEKSSPIHAVISSSDLSVVYAPKNFPGMSESTFLSRSFGDQGVRLRIRKEPRTLLYG
jgi:hypothetical protein